MTMDGAPGLNYLCPGLKRFSKRVQMDNGLQNPASGVMQTRRRI
jgi:hypothetical protein